MLGAQIECANSAASCLAHCARYSRLAICIVDYAVDDLLAAWQYLALIPLVFCSCRYRRHTARGSDCDVVALDFQAS
jgi:hypothetical protein